MSAFGPYRCKSGNHVWVLHRDAEKCCNPEWVRASSTSRQELERDGVVGVLMSIQDGQVWYRGWKRRTNT